MIIAIFLVMLKKINILVIILSLFSISSLMSHSGGTDSYGCHNNSKTGGYHCHNKKY